MSLSFIEEVAGVSPRNPWRTTADLVPGEAAGIRERYRAIAKGQRCRRDDIAAIRAVAALFAETRLDGPSFAVVVGWTAARA